MHRPQPFIVTRLRNAIAQADVIALIAMVLVFAAIAALFWLPRARSGDVPRRSICASNLKGMGTAFYTYANENKEIWPIAAHVPADVPETGRVNYAPGKIGLNRTQSTTDEDIEVSTTRNLWMLIRWDMAAAKSFICPKSVGDTPNTDSVPQDYWDFAYYFEVSYGYQVPYGMLGRPTSDCDLRMALAADKGPFGAALEAGAKNPGTPHLNVTSPPETWSPWNSPNHGGEGQNVLYADAHAEWQSKPCIGVGYDNIYTRWSDATGGGERYPEVRVQGRPPTSNETPFSDTDSLIYP